MKAQTTAIVAVIAVLAIAFASVSGITYSWFSDTESSDITVSTGYVDVSTSDYIVEGDSLLSVNGVSADEVPSNISLIYTDDYSLVSDSKTIYVCGNPSNVDLKISYKVIFDASLLSTYVVNVTLPDGITAGFKITGESSTVVDEAVIVNGFKTINGDKDEYTVEITIDSLTQNVKDPITITNTIIQNADSTQFINNSHQLKNAINGLGTAADKEVVLFLGSGKYDTNLKIPGGSDVTFVGNGKGTVLNGQIASTSSTEGTLTFKNLTINVSDAITDSTGISQTGKSAIAIWGNQTVICENVTFNMDLKDSTAITSWWDTGVGTSIIVKDCTFNCNGERPIRATGNVTVDGCTFNDPYRYAVQLTAKASTATELDNAVINFFDNEIVNGPNGKDFVYGIQLEGADYGCNNLIIKGSGNTITNGGADSTLYYCECGMVDHATIQFKATDSVMVHETPTDVFKDCLDAGMANINLPAGDYVLPGSNKDMTLSGTKDVEITINKPNFTGADLVLSGVTVKGSGYATGVQHVNTVTYNGVTIIGEMCLYGEKVVFNNCTFELNNQYVWTYGAKEVEFNSCTFNTNGKAILIYNEGAGASQVTVRNCTFNATDGAKAGAIANQNCAAIEIDNFQSSGTGAAHVLITSGNTYDSDFSGEWRIKRFVAGNDITVNGTAYAQIAIDGKLMTIDSSNNVTVLP